MNLNKSKLVATLASVLMLSASIVGLGGTAANAASAPYTQNFDAMETYTGIDFDGNTTSLVTDQPTGDGFTSGKAIKMDNQGAAWAGTKFVLPSTSSFISSTNAVGSLSVYSPDALDRCFLAKLEGNGAPIERVVHVTAGWQTINVDYSANYTAGKNYNVLALMPNLAGVGCNTWTNKDLTTWYVDNISFPGARDADEAVVVVPRTSPATLVNFESNDSSGYSLTNFGGASTSIVADAPAGGSTGSAAALKVISVGDSWAGTTFLKKGAKVSLISAGKMVAKANIYSPTAGQIIMMKLENPDVPGLVAEVRATSVVGWKTYSFDFVVGGDLNQDYPMASLFLNFNGPKSDAPFYVDDISFNGAVGAELSSSGETVTPVLVNFESSDSSGYSLTDFGGNASSKVSDAPAGGSAGSSSALKIVSVGECWAGTTFLSAANTLLANGNAVVKANIYSPAADKVIRLKLENSGNPDQNKEVDATSVAGWNTYSFNFAGFNSAVKYNKVSIFTNFTCGTGAKNTDAWYVDDVAFLGASGAALAPVVPSVLVNFESNDSSGYSFTDFGGNASSKVSDAPDGGSVGSTSALKIVSVGECWAGTTFLSAANTLLANGNAVVKANIYSPAADKVIRLKLENSGNPDQNKEVDATSVAGWNTYSFNFAGFNSAVKYNKVSIFTNFTCGTGAKNTDPWYVDDIAFLGATGAALSGGNGGGTTPTPFTGNAVIRLVGADSTNTFNRQGDTDFFVSQGWYRGGLRVFTKQVPVGSTQHFTFVVSNAANGANLANTAVHFVFGKDYSGSNAKVNIGNAVSTGAQQIVDGVTDANGQVSFDLVNTDVASAAANNPGTNLSADYTGTHLFTQVTAWVTNQGQDSIDLFDLVYYKPADAPVTKTAVARMNGLDSTNAFEGSCLVGDWCKYYAAGLRYFEKGLTVGSTTNFSYSVSDTDGAPYANKNVYLLLGKAWSGSTAKVTVNGVSTTGAETWNGNDQAKITLTTNAQGQVSFSLTNNDVAADADPYQAGNLAHPNGGKHLFTQMTLVGEKGNLDVIDVVDLNFYKPQDAVPPTVYNVRLADWNASNSFDGTHVWGDAGISDGWFDVNTGYFAHYVAAGSTFDLRYRVTTAAGANAANGTVVTVHLGAAWSGSNASFASGENTVNGVTKWGPGGQLDQASFTTTVQNGYVTIPLTNSDLAVDATPNPGSATANPDGRNPLFMQVKVTVDGNSVTHQDWVNIVVTQPAGAPTVSSVSATSGKKGQAIDIVGTNLGDALGTSVVLYTAATTKAAAISTPVTVLSVSADGTRMTVASPAISQKGKFKVTTGGGSSTAAAFFSSSITNTSKPTITLTASLIKEVGSTFTLNGTNIASASSIKIGTVAAPFSILTANSVVVTVPAGAVSGSTISATNLGGTVTSTKFVYQAAVVASRTAAARVGQTVTITGSNLKATSVVFGGNKSAKPVINTGDTLTVVVPTGALTGAIKITTGAGVVYTDSFTVTPPAPTVTSFTPSTGKKGVAIITVKGTNLAGATVTLGSTPVTLSAGANSTSFKFVIPAGATTGKINVTTAGGTVSSANNLTVTN